MIEWPDLEAPVLIVGLSGWIDAGNGAGTAIEVLDAELSARTAVRFDGDTFIDYRARRPTMQLREGINTNLIWPEIVLKAGTDRVGNGVLLLAGTEPDSNWRQFADAVAALASELDVRMMVGLGAYPYTAPHTRPSRLAVSMSSAELGTGLQVERSSVDVPAGIEAVLEQRLAEVGVPTIGLWAQVPHYVANVPYPGATLALLDGLGQVAGVVSDAVEVRRAADEHRQRLDELVANSSEHTSMVRQLEAVWDAEAAEQAGVSSTPNLGSFPQGPLPSGDELAAELERFLRDQGR
jgi:hypothetical protein